jgi:hypothetical protein
MFLDSHNFLYAVEETLWCGATGIMGDDTWSSFANSVRSSIASDGIKQTQQGLPTGGRFADSACRLLAVQ